MKNARSIVPGLILTGAIMTVSAFAAVAPASAGGTRAAMSVRVGDLDLTSVSGARAALGRIERAASKACGGPQPVLALGRQSAHRACVQDLTDRAVRKIGSPKLTALRENRINEERLALRDLRGRD